MNERASTYEGPAFIQKARAAIELPEVKEALKTLARHDLGAAILHEHDPTTGAMIPLAPGRMQLERDLRISFVDADSPEVAGMIPVTFRWDEKAETVRGCSVCSYSGRREGGDHC